MITNVSTGGLLTTDPLIQRPDTRAEAERVVLAIATGASKHDLDDYVEQCARILSVKLWRNVDASAFSALVEDISRLEALHSGASVADMYGEDGESKRGDWVFYHETQIKWMVEQIVDAAGYRR